MLRRMMMAGIVAPVAPALDTSMLAGRTYVFSGPESDVFRTDLANSGRPANNENAQRLDTILRPDLSRTMTTVGSSVYLENRFGPGYHAVRANGAFFSFGTIPSGSASSPTGVPQPLSQFFSANGKLLILSGIIHNCGTNQGLPIYNDVLFAGNWSEMGLYVYKSGSNAIMQFAVNGGTALTRTVALNTPFVVACYQRSSQLGMSLNAGAFVTRTEAPGTLSEPFEGIRDNSGAGLLSVTMAAVVACNAQNDNTSIIAASKSAGALVGLTL